MNAAVWRQRFVLAAVAFVPLWWTAPGKVSADTKSYLTIEPGRLLAKAPWMWDRSIGLGTVSHQTIGYLFPLGPYYWAMDRLGTPDWLAQRLWLGLVFFAAGCGVIHLVRLWGWSGPGVLVAALAYQLSPYVLDYAARISVILLPWAALGWLLSFTIRAVRDGGWRWPAAFALVVTVVGGVNATALVLAGIAPVLWIVHALATRAVTRRAAIGASARIGVLTATISAWWLAGLAVQGRYGIPILRYTETYEAVARTSTAPEVLRGLGYWFFYGQDKVSAWVTPARPYTQQLWLVVLSYAVPAAALVALAATRWRQRGFVAALVVVGVVVSVGSHPFAHPSPYGSLFKRLSHTTAGNALRSTPRAVPLVVLALALAFGAGVAALAARWPRRRGALSIGACALLAANLPSLWTGSLLTAAIERPEHLPAYWTQAAAAIDGGDHQRRVMETPGADFANYRWGGTVDPITPGLTDRPYVARELVPYGSAAGADLLNAFERRLQDRIDEPAATAPLMRLLSVGTVVARNDLQYERYRLARPRTMADALAAADGLSPSQRFGAPVPNVPIARLPLVDAEELTTPADVIDPAPVQLYDVTGSRPIVAARPTSTPVIASADGEGLVDLAAAGLLPADAPLLSSAELVNHPGALDAAMADGARLIVTDSNRRQARRWGSVRENLGYTETAGERPLRADPTDNRLDVFPGSNDAARTVAEQRGVARVQATGYGNPITYTPEDRAAMALDHDPLTAWRVGAFADVSGERIDVDLAAPTTTDHITLLQPTSGARNRWITKVKITVDGRRSIVADLDDSSRAAPGQQVSLGAATTMSRLSIEILATNFTKLPGYRGISAVGFAEIGIDGVPAVTEVLRMPTDLLASAGAASADHQLTMVMTRDRASALEPNRDDPELSMARTFTLPAPRSMTVGGAARLAVRASDPVIDAATAEVGTPDPSRPSAIATATARLPGDVGTRGASAIDGDPSTAWQTPIDAPLQQLTIDNVGGAPLAADHLDLVVRADGRHSVPTRLTVASDSGDTATAEVPPITDGAGRDTIASVRVALARTLTGRRLTIAIDAVREVRSIDYSSETAVVQPVAIAEIGVPGLRASAPAARIDTGCRRDLLIVDGSPVAVRVTGVAPTGGRASTLAVAACDGPVALAAGGHEVRTAIGRDVGIDIDRLIFDSPAPANASATPATAPSPRARIVGETRTSYDVEITGALPGQPFWLTVGQSHNAGWHASLAGHDLGPSILVDGYANGWRITAPATQSPLRITVAWTPQRSVWLSLGLSAVSALVCVALLFVRPRRDQRRLHRPGPSAMATPMLQAVDERPWSMLRPSRRLIIAGATALTAWFVAGAVVAVVVTVFALLAPLMRRRAARFLALAPAVAMAAVIAYVAAKQVRYRLPTDLEWPRAFEPTHVIAWCAIGFAVVLVALSAASGATAAEEDDGAP